LPPPEEQENEQAEKSYILEPYHIEALLLFHLKVSPEEINSWDNETFAYRWAQLKFCLGFNSVLKGV
jgi:hypothetical protein